jgi:hypothetical protein
MKKGIKVFIMLACVILISTTMYAQNPGDPGGGDPDASIPLDEGLLTVLISGAAIGITKLIKKQKSN